MEYYMIHCCNSRMWYVTKFLVPSMIQQGIPRDHIFIYQDKNNIGNLRAFVDSSNRLVSVCYKKGISGVWHLQDDVVLSKKFCETTNKYPAGIVCGFTCNYNENPKPGAFKLSETELWFSFPCIRIPTYILSRFARWANESLWQSKYFREWVMRNKGDDLIFQEWLYDQKDLADFTHVNLNPNVVDHIDTLIGGTVVNGQRDADFDTHSIFWNEQDVIEDLKIKLEEYKKIT